MFKIKMPGLLLGCALVLSGCATWFQSKTDSFDHVEIKPVMKIKHANSSAKIWYLLGRYYQGKMNYKKAISAYQVALNKDPHYVDVHNGLGVIFAAQGNHPLAIQHFHLAIELAPKATYLHNNLGYAYLIQGQENKAVESLEQALRLDPENKSARINLTNASEKLGLTRAEIVVETAATSPTLTATHEELAFDDKTSKIEISNGNGVTGMANEVSNFFRQLGFSSMRLTNHPTFQQGQTQLYYRTGHSKLAEQVNQYLPVAVEAIETTDLRPDIQVKLLLGKDFSSKVAFFNSSSETKVVRKEQLIVAEKSLAY